MSKIAVSVMLAALLLASCGSDDATTDTSPGTSQDAAPDTQSTADAPEVDEDDSVTTDADGGDAEIPSDDAATDDPGDVLAALLRAAEAEKSREGTTDLYRAYLDEVFPCLAQSYVVLAGDSLVSPYDAAGIDAAVANNQSLDTMTVDLSSLGPDVWLESIDSSVECSGGLRGERQWNLAFDFSSSFLTGSATDWLGYSDCILTAVDPIEDELVATSYYWYYDAGHSGGPLDDPSAYFDLSTALSTRVSKTNGDSTTFDDPCVKPG